MNDCLATIFDLEPPAKTRSLLCNFIHSFAEGIRKSGVLFVKPDSDIEKNLSMYFMKETLGIVDDDFTKECAGDVVTFLRKGIRKYSSKIISSYRKHLTACEFLH